MEVTVIRAGLLTSVQDGGRTGHRAAGMPLSGAADPFALRVANLLVGNPEGAAGLEMTLVGPELSFSADTLVAVGGAEPAGFPAWKPSVIRAGEPVRFGELRRGCRAVLAIEGGVEVEPVLGSSSTYLRGELGGFHGRPLRDGDLLRAGAARRRSAAGGRFVAPSILPAYSPSPTVRVVRGAQAEDFRDALYQSVFAVTARSDRMGIRLEGPRIERRRKGELLSTPVAPGTIQIPPDGQPIVLLADAQTIGGYPQMAHVISVDLPLVAQLRAGDSLRFQEVDLSEAQRLLLARERDLAILREGLAHLFR